MAHGPFFFSVWMGPNGDESRAFPRSPMRDLKSSGLLHHPDSILCPPVLGLVQTKVVVPHSLNPERSPVWVLVEGRGSRSSAGHPHPPASRSPVQRSDSGKPASECYPAAPAAPGPRARARAPGGALALGHPPNGRAQGLNVILS